MTYNEFINQQDIINSFVTPNTNLFPNFMKYIASKYANFELRYTTIFFKELFQALIYEYTPLLKDVEDAINIRRNNTFTKENLGDNRVRSRTSNNQTTGSNIDAYLGYSEGDFSNQKTNISRNDSGSDTSREFNLLNTVRYLEQEGRRLGWFKIEKELMKLFNTIYLV